MVEPSGFDVFLCHNSEDKEAVIEIAKKLISEHQIKPWLDDWELQPGLPWQPELENQINQIKSVAVFIGQKGIGPWQDAEIDAFLREFKRRACPVIPVLLRDAPQKPTLPIFLQGMTWVDFREQTRAYTDPMYKLIWGITGLKPETIVKVIPQPSNNLSIDSFINRMKKYSFFTFIKKGKEDKEDKDNIAFTVQSQLDSGKYKIVQGFFNAPGRGKDDNIVFTLQSQLDSGRHKIVIGIFNTRNNDIKEYRVIKAEEMRQELQDLHHDAEFVIYN